MSYSEKIYPQLDPSAPMDDEGQSYRLKMVDGIEKFLRDDICARDHLVKKRKSLSKALTYSEYFTISLTVAVGSALAATGIGVPITIAIAASGSSITIAIRKVQTFFELKLRKHASIKTLAQAKLDTISGLVSKAIEDGHITDIEYKLILKEKTNYQIMKEAIRKKTKQNVKKITDKQREAFREEGKQAFLKQHVNKNNVT